MEPTLLYCKTRHARFRPVQHSFEYPLLYIGLDLDRIVDDSWLLGAGRRSILRVDVNDYLGEAGGYQCIRDKIRWHIQQHGLSEFDIGKTWLVTTPRLFGYAFNPVSFHYVYDRNDTLRLIVLEVSNTFSEKHVYLLEQRSSRSGRADRRKGYHSTDVVAKMFHVSPFNDRTGYYQVASQDPLKSYPHSVDVNIVLQREKASEKLMFARVKSHKSLSVLNASLWEIVWFLFLFGIHVFLVFPRILKEAAVLNWGRKLRMYIRPEPPVSKGAVQRQGVSKSDRFYASLLSDYIEELLKSAPSKFNVDLRIVPASGSQPAFRRFLVPPGMDIVQTVKVDVLHGSFFTRMALNPSIVDAFNIDCRASQQPVVVTSDDAQFEGLLRYGESRIPLSSVSLVQIIRHLASTLEGRRNCRVVDPLPRRHCLDEYVRTSKHGKPKFALLSFQLSVLKALVLRLIVNGLFLSVATFAEDSPGNEWSKLENYYRFRNWGLDKQ